MTSLELRASLSLGFLYSLRLLGLFLILPVFAAHAQTMPGASDPIWVGLALGAYGLTQGLLQIPFGWASDQWGRKPVIAIGMVIFGLGSIVAGAASSVQSIVVGRALQGAGAVSGAITALLADCTSAQSRTKAMGMIGASIGVTFALSLVFAPPLYGAIGLSGLFYLTAAAIALGLVVLWRWVPKAAQTPPVPFSMRVLREVFFEPSLWRLNMGNFILQAVLMGMFVVVPRWLEAHAGLPLTTHWKVYLPVIMASLVLMVPVIIWMERHQKIRLVFHLAIVWTAVSVILFAAQPTGLVALASLLCAFFVGFNVLEASLPSLVSKLAPAANRGLALGIYNTLQALGLFVGAATGGWLASRYGDAAVFYLGAVALLGWLGFSVSMRRWSDSPQGARLVHESRMSSE